MPIPFALLFALLAGLSLSWLARTELARADAPLVLTRPFLVAVALGACVFVPVAGYFAALHGDWAYLYLVRWGKVPSAVDLLLVLGVGAQVPLGFALASPWAIARRGTRLFQGGAVLAGLLLVATMVAWRRLGISATYAQFHGGFGALPVGKSPLGRGVLLSWTALAAGYAWSVHVLRSGRRA